MIVINILVLGAKGPANHPNFIDQVRQCDVVGIGPRQESWDWGLRPVSGGYRSYWVVLGGPFPFSELSSCTCEMETTSES